MSDARVWLAGLVALPALVIVASCLRVDVERLRRLAVASAIALVLGALVIPLSPPLRDFSIRTSAFTWIPGGENLIDARSAIAAIAESAPFEIVLLDVRLPDSDDLVLFDRVRSLAPDARIIVMTAHGTRELTERAMNRGAFTVVSKPFELTELAALVTRAREARPS